MKTGTYEGQQFIDGKPVKKYLFIRQIRIALQNSPSAQCFEVHAFNKDHAIERLLEHVRGSERRDWEFMDELGPDHFVGALGEVLYMLPAGAVLFNQRNRIQ